jgi:hypothetical protein
MSQVEDLQAVNGELTRKLKLLQNANKREDDLRDSSPPASEEILAKAKLGVAEAELGVAQAKGASTDEIAEFKEEITELMRGVALKRKAYELTLPGQL